MKRNSPGVFPAYFQPILKRKRKHFFENLPVLKISVENGETSKEHLLLERAWARRLDGLLALGVEG